MTIIYLLTAKPPHTMDFDGENINFQSYVNIPDHLALYIKEMIQNNYKKRIHTARTALLYLERQKSPAYTTTIVDKNRMILYINSFLLNFFLQTCLGLTAFWLEDNTALYWIYSKLALILGVLLPLDIYPDWMQRILRIRQPDDDTIVVETENDSVRLSRYWI